MPRLPIRISRNALMPLVLAASIAFAGVLFDARPSAAAWEGSPAEDGVAKAVDAIVIRPLSVIRVMVGAVLLVPSSLLASPGGMEGLRNAFDVLISAPMEFAFDRPLGQF